ILLLGVPLGSKAVVFSYVLVGLLGMRALLRDLGVTGLPAAAGATVFGCNGFVALHFSGGHVAFLGFLLVPLAYLFYHRAVLGNRRDAAVNTLLLGGVLTWM